MGNQICCNNTAEEDEKDLLLKAPSVHYLHKVFLKEVRDAGLDLESATVYDLEDLRSDDFGLIRRKGGNIICPRDGRIGASYVDSIIEDGNDGGKKYVGRANVMLSYVWGYRVKIIVETLVAKCRSDGRDTKTTYVWICCLCNNQHRIGESEVPFNEFRQIFFGTVTGAGTVWCLMWPWYDPEYLKRVWCIFESHVANTEPGVKAEIIMPEDQARDMIESLNDFDKFLDVLAATSIDNAKASREEDKRNIIAMVEEGVGCLELNNLVNAMMREWAAGCLIKVVDQEEGITEEGGYKGEDEDVWRSEKSATANKLGDIGLALWNMSLNDEALRALGRCLEIRGQIFGNDHEDVAVVYNNIGLVKLAKGDLDDALEIYYRGLGIYEKTLGTEDVRIATSYNNIGGVMQNKGDLDAALDMYKKCLAIREKSLEANHPLIATSYNNIGGVMQLKGDLNGALDMYEKSLVIREVSLGSKHPDTATSYNNIGSVMYCNGDLNGALDMFKRCLAIEEKSLGGDHPHTASTKEIIEYVGNDIKNKSV